MISSMEGLGGPNTPVLQTISNEESSKKKRKSMVSLIPKILKLMAILFGDGVPVKVESLDLPQLGLFAET